MKQLVRQIIFLFLLSIALGFSGVRSAHASQSELDLVYVGPRCLGTGYTNTYLMSGLVEYFEQNPGHEYLASAGLSVLSDDARLIFPERDMNRTDLSPQGVKLQLQGKKRELVEQDVPVLVSPYEVVLQLPYQTILLQNSTNIA